MKKLEPTNLILVIADEDHTEFKVSGTNHFCGRVAGGIWQPYLPRLGETGSEKFTVLGTYLDYEHDFDVKPYLKETIMQEVDMEFMTGQPPSMVEHCWDYQTNEYMWIYHEWHSLQSLILANGIEFDGDAKYIFLLQE